MFSDAVNEILKDYFRCVSDLCY